MARLPKPGEDQGQWGQILNDYLSQTHKADGTLKDGVVTNAAIAANAVTSNEIVNGTIQEAQLSTGVQTKLNATSTSVPDDNSVTTVKLVDGAVTTAKIADGTVLETDLAPAVQTKLNAGAAAGVSSVNTRTGDVTLAKADVGLANVDNTSDANKPVSTAVQTALNARALSTHTHTLDNLSDVTAAGATDGQSLVYTSGAWGPATVSAGGGSVVDATPTIKGVVQLAGDLGGTAAAPTVPGLAAKADTTDIYTRTQSDVRYVRTVNGTAPDGAGNVAVSAGATGVSSVNTRTGDVTLAKADVGLANVDNTSDANKPVSTATQTALNTKANTTHTHSGADINSGTVAAARLGSGTADATTVLYGDGTWKTAPAGGGGSDWNIRAVSTGGTTNAVHNDWIIANPTSGAITVALPAPVANARVRVKRNGVAGNSIMITTPNGGLLDGGEPTMATLNAGWSSMDYESDGTNWFTV